MCGVWRVLCVWVYMEDGMREKARALLCEAGAKACALEIELVPRGGRVV